MRMSKAEIEEIKTTNPTAYYHPIAVLSRGEVPRDVCDTCPFNPKEHVVNQNNVNTLMCSGFRDDGTASLQGRVEVEPFTDYRPFSRIAETEQSRIRQRMDDSFTGVIKEGAPCLRD